MACRSLVLTIALSCLCMGSLNLSNATTDTLRPGQSLHDWEQLTSAGGIFTFGFFTIADSTIPSATISHYVGIWYKSDPYDPVWIANQETPIRDSSGVVAIDTDGKLKITYQGGNAIIIASSQSKNVAVTLLDSGNFVLREINKNGAYGHVLWQSFDFPTNTLLPGMKLGLNHKTGKNWSLTSWSSEQIPIPGAFELGMDPNGTDQLVIFRRGHAYWTSGMWKNGSFENAPDLTSSIWVSGFEFKFVSNENEKYFSYYVTNKDTFPRWELDLLGQILKATEVQNATIDQWDFEYAAVCDLGVGNTAAVCLKEKPTKCRKGSEYFVKTRGYFGEVDSTYVFYPETSATLSLSDCHAICWNNCTCVAYQSLSTDGIGCLFRGGSSNFTVDVNVGIIYLLVNS